MLKLLFLTIIIYILITVIVDEDNDDKKTKVVIVKNEIKPVNNDVFIPFDKSNESGLTTVKNIPDLIKKEGFSLTDNEWTFDIPNPWSKITFNENEEYPYHFYIKTKIPSLNDYEAWKQVVPNLNFEPKKGELIIPSKDESSALALANLIIINFTGQMTLDNILDKKLIQISVSKAKTHELVRTKLREQINTTMANNSNKKPNLKMSENTFQDDLAANKVDFKKENFKDTFQHFESMTNDVKEPFGYDGFDYSYL